MRGTTCTNRRPDRGRDKRKRGGKQKGRVAGGSHTEKLKLGKLKAERGRRKPWRRQAPPVPESVMHRELAFQAQTPQQSRERVLANQLRRGVLNAPVESRIPKRFGDKGKEAVIRRSPTSNIEHPTSNIQP